MEIRPKEGHHIFNCVQQVRPKDKNIQKQSSRLESWRSVAAINLLQEALLLPREVCPIQRIHMNKYIAQWKLSKMIS